MPSVRIFRRTTAFGLYDGLTVGAIERVSDHLPQAPAHQPRQRLWKIVARRVVLAAGAIERPIVFGGNDRPGIMMAGAVRTYLNRFAVAPGKRAVVFTATDDGWNTAEDLANSGIHVEAIIDVRSEVDASQRALAKRIGAPAFPGSHVIATHGGRVLRAMVIRSRDGSTTRVRADTLAISGGWNPTLALSTHLGGRPRWNNSIAAFVPGQAPNGMTVVGAANGSFLLTEALREGAAAGVEAAEATGHRSRSVDPPIASDERAGVRAFWSVSAATGKAFVDFQHDVTEQDIALGAREGYRSIELLKRYTTLGMGTDQGKTSNVNGLAVLAALTERSVPEVGTTVFRPPFSPVAIGALVGHHRGKDFEPIRRTSSHGWAECNGATFTEAAQWLRAQWYTAAGDRDVSATIEREVRAVRTNVGVCDVSTLGKIDVLGPDAGAFLDRIYANTLSTLPLGKVRYGLMLREDGHVFDDGTVARLSSEHFLVTTTTVNAGKVMMHLEHARQVIWPGFDVQIVSATEQWAQYSIAGPKARGLLLHLLRDALDVSNDAFPFMACAEFIWRGIRARLFRISFSGELAYEFAVPARYGDSTIRAIMSAGAEWGAVPYGLEALSTLRIEKGHVAGPELNGHTTATDLGLGRLLSKKKDFIGRVLSERPGLIDPRRPALVGIRPTNRKTRIDAGAHLLGLNDTPSLMNDQGYVTSTTFSPTLGYWIGLALVAGGQRHIGGRMRLFDALRHRDTEVEIVSPVFVDPEGQRVLS